jgi:hypothetical protein
VRVYRVELMIIDHDGIGGVEIADVLQNAHYPNRCIAPEVMDIESRDIGKWSDDHPLNSAESVAEFARLFR